MSWREAFLQASMTSWQLELVPTLVAVVVGVVYIRGFIGIHRSQPARFPWWRAWSFILGEVVLLLAIFSPLDALGGFLLSAHMAQHFLLLMVVPPLLLMGAPANPMLWGLPATVRTDWLGPFLASPVVHRIGYVLVHPITGWISMVTMTWLWHVPVLYELALVDPFWHQVEHGLFLGSAILFWFPVIQPWPSRSIWPRWAMIPYLLTADLQNTIFSAFFAFSPRVIYPIYEQVTPALGLDAMEDQALAAGLMWVPGSIIFVLPIAGVVRTLLRRSGPEGQRERWARAQARSSRAPVESIALPVLGAESPPREAVRAARERRHFDLLKLPLIGPMLASRRGRHAVRLLMLALAVLVVVDGFWGPRTSSMNLAGVLPWTLWRGIAVLLLLVGGNLLCMACPFTLPRTLAGRFLPRKLSFPRALRTKWFAVGLVVCWLWAYEVLALWDSPAGTAWVVIGYFVAAFLVDAFFRGASFCKYVCPIGQFHFVQSMVSPVEVAPRDASVCAECTTQECIRGSATVAGCGTDLFLPRKVGNLDCTFCLDCADACPRDNVGIKATSLGSGLTFPDWRSSLGRLSDRLDWSALLLVLVFGAFANATGMTAPILDWQDDLTATWGFQTHAMAATILLGFELLVLPALVAVALVLILPRSVGPTPVGLNHRGWLGRSALALVPLGVVMWVVHYQFHFVTSWAAIIPISHRALLDVSGGSLEGLLGTPSWSAACCAPVPPWLLEVEILLLNLGFVMSWAIAFAFARAALPTARTARVLLGILPLGVVQFALLLWGIWIVLQPMQMRGTLLP
jgi:cytochrome c oxidase assembly factor CtaG/ferredoxin